MPMTCIGSSRGRRAGRPVRQQRRRDERARAGREASGGCRVSWSPTNRRSPPFFPTARTRWPRLGRSTRPTCEAAGAPGMAHFIAVVGHKGPVPRRLRRAAGAGPGDVRDADRGQWRPDRRAAGAEHDLLLAATSPISTRCARRSTRIVHRRRGWIRGRACRTAARLRRRRTTGHERVIFPSDHGGFMGGEYGQPPVSPRRSPRSCARCSPSRADAQSDRQRSIWGRPWIPRVCDSSPQW